MAGRDWNVRDITLRFEDAAGLGMTIGPGDGAIEISESNQANAQVVRVLDRGRNDGHVITEDYEQSLSVTIRCLTQVETSSLAARVRDFVMQSGYFASAQSVSNDDGIWAFKAILTYSSPSGGVTQTKTLPKCVGTVTEQHGFPSNTFGIELMNQGAITIA